MDLRALQRRAFDYFVAEANPANGLVRDSDRAESPASIAAVGMGLSAYVVGVERGWMRRADGVARTLAALRFFRDAPHGPEPDATGHRGFYYHFLDMESGRRVWRCELSTIDTTLLIAGALTSAAYFDLDTPAEREIRDAADELYRRVDWAWACDGGLAVSLGWRPGRGFIPYHWTGYNEALPLYVLGLGSPTHPLSSASYDAWLSTYAWKRLYGHEFVYAGPLFVHQLPHVWLDLRGVADPYMRTHDSDYFENTRRATLVQREYAIRNPKGFAGYGADVWGLSASSGPGTGERLTAEAPFWGYRARGVPWGPDDGTLSPGAVLASLPFAPEEVLSAIAVMRERYPAIESRYGFRCSLNPSCPAENGSGVWIAAHHHGIDLGPIVVGIENHLTGWFWELMRRSEPFSAGLQRAGFGGGWLG